MPSYNKFNVFITLQDTISFQTVNLTDFLAVKTDGKTVHISVDCFSMAHFILNDFIKQMQTTGNMQAILGINDVSDPNIIVESFNISFITNLSQGKEVIWTLK